MKYQTLRPVFGSRAAEDISKHEIVRWLTSTAADREWAPTTKNRWQAAFSLAFRVGMENGNFGSRRTWSALRAIGTKSLW